VLRIELDRLLEVLRRLDVTSLRAEHAAQRKPRLTHRRIDLHSAPRGNFGFDRTALIAPDHCKMDERTGGFGSKSHRVVEGGLRVFQLSECFRGVFEIYEC